ncbi:uncharacterized protein [Branchiostoma lanceolatum]|uniref:uncharacterized protein n=1 Tax=Branchiostoma lanceolatum TaxID=7740 RepID=UPI003454D2BE
MAKLSMFVLPFLIFVVAALTPVHRQQDLSTTWADPEHDIIPDWTMAQLRYDGCRIYAEFEPNDLSGKMCESEELKDVRLTDIHDKIRSELKYQPAGNEAPKPALLPPNYVSLGCWRDKNPGRAIPTLEGTDPRLDGGYMARENAIEKCYQVAKDQGFSVFALQNGGHCCSSASAGLTYKKYGSSTSCGADGEGGPFGNHVYQITEPLPSTEMKKEQLYEQLYDLLKQEKQKTREQDETISTLQAKINDETPTDSNSFPGKPAPPLQPCPDGYSQYNTKCYKLSTDKMAFSAAKDVCQQDGGILAIINTQDTSDPVVKTIRADGEPYWIGLTDVRKEGTFVRSDEAESPAAYTNWYPHQPDNGGGEDCVAMSRDQDWNDVPCSSRLNFICEKVSEL